MTTRSGPPEALRARLLAAAAHEPPTRPGTWRRRATGYGLLSAGWLIVTTTTLGVRPDAAQLSQGALAQTLIVLAVVATVASVAAVARGPAMVGTASETLLVVVSALPVALLIAVSAIDPRGPATLMWTGLAATILHSVACDLLVTVVALPLIGLGWALSRGLVLSRPGLSGASLGLAAATWAHIVVRIHCPIGGAGHAIVGHVLPAISLMALGAWSFRRAGDHRPRGKG